MAEWKLFEGDVAPFTDSEFYRDREAAHHMEEENHHERLMKAFEYIQFASEAFGCKTFSDLGCGDGGLVQLAAQNGYNIWGYDMQPKNVEYAKEVRKADVRFTNFEQEDVEYGDCSILTEVLEHVSDPHGLVRDLPSSVVIASSPVWETPDNHYEFHNWAWDMSGYSNLLTQGGYKIFRHAIVVPSQIILGVRK